MSNETEKDKAQIKKERLAEQLRANLRRRKAQSRGQKVQNSPDNSEK